MRSLRPLEKRSLSGSKAWPLAPHLSAVLWNPQSCQNTVLAKGSPEIFFARETFMHEECICMALFSNLGGICMPYYHRKISMFTCEVIQLFEKSQIIFSPKFLTTFPSWH